MNSCSASPGEIKRSPRTASTPEFQTVWPVPRGTNTKPPEVTVTSGSPRRKSLGRSRYGTLVRARVNVKRGAGSPGWKTPMIAT